MTLKKENAKPLCVGIGVHAVLFWIVLTGKWNLAGKGWEQLLSFLTMSSIAAVLGVATFLLQGLLSSDVKARMVFCRFRGNPYPGSEAFSKWMLRDPRIDPEIIRQRHGPLPQEPDRQNLLWYRLLKKHEEKAGIQDGHRRYLLARDLASNTLIFGFIAGIGVWLGKSPVWGKLVFDVGTMLVFALMIVVARNYGIRLVTTVLAAESSEEEGETKCKIILNSTS